MLVLKILLLKFSVLENISVKKLVLKSLVLKILLLKFSVLQNISVKKFSVKTISFKIFNVKKGKYYSTIISTRNF